MYSVKSCTYFKFVLIKILNVDHFEDIILI